MANRYIICSRQLFTWHVEMDSVTSMGNKRIQDILLVQCREHGTFVHFASIQIHSARDHASLD